ncbi:sensor histidine kinase [Paenibacillus polymyxa]|uniref:sensor histidine kinase n=1 Tax=Paenibacillus polymyxa TaxID=1406 RepID=UPI002AB3A7DE|nr:GHKL domain-containing protein [Paenibacillus polymyxa]MDY8026215.1 GHKL domain-containing protein [Paenibacillus polymyxa]
MNYCVYLNATSLSNYSLFLFNEAKQSDFSNPILNLFLLSISLHFMLIVVLIVHYLKKGRKYKLGFMYYFVILIGTSFNILIHYGLLSFMEYNLFFIMSITGILGMNVLIVFLMDKLIEKSNLSCFFQKQMMMQEKRYKETTRSLNDIKRSIHDFKKQLVFVRACLQEQRTEEGINHINQTLENLGSPPLPITTGHLVLDALVNHTSSIADRNGIAFFHHIHINPATISIGSYDLCIVLGNVFDNAIEAVMQLPRKKEHSIHLEIFTDHSALWIYVRNSKNNCMNTVFPTKTSKFSLKNHGFGLLNIQQVIQKYGGYLNTTITNSHFQIMIMLPCNNS